MLKVTQLANGRAKLQTQALCYTASWQRPRQLWLITMWGPRKERSRVPVSALEEVSPEQCQSASSIEGTDTTVLEQGPQLGRNETEMSRRGHNSRVWRGGVTWELLGGSHQLLQLSLRGIEYLRAQVSHVLFVGQVGDGEVDNKRHQERNCSCRKGESKLRSVLSQAPG